MTQSGPSLTSVIEFNPPENKGYQDFWRLVVIQLHKYVLYRAEKLQRKRISKPTEAILTAGIYTTLPVAAALTAIFIWLSERYGFSFAQREIRGWIIAAPLFGLIYFVQYIAFLRKGKFVAARKQFDEADPYGKFGTAVTWIYIVVPVVAMLVVAGLYRQ